jgi:hypothetical protein
MPSLTSTPTAESRTRDRLRPLAVTGVLAVGALLGVGASGASAATAVHRAVGSAGPFGASDCSKRIPYGAGSGATTIRFCMRHSGTKVTAGYLINLPAGSTGAAGFYWSIFAHPFTPGSPDVLYERFQARNVGTAGKTEAGWVVRGGVPSNVCAKVASPAFKTTSPQRTGQNKAC